MQPTINSQGLSNIWVFRIIPFVIACLSIWQKQKSVSSHEWECNCPTKLRSKTVENILILYKRDLVLRGSTETVLRRFPPGSVWKKFLKFFTLKPRLYPCPFELQSQLLTFWLNEKPHLMWDYRTSNSLRRSLFPVGIVFMKYSIY